MADFRDPLLGELQERLGAGPRAAPSMLRRLGRLTGMAIPPSSVLYVPIRALTLWDVHVLFALERWKREGGHDARRWLVTLGEAEALSSLAGLRHDNPDWTFPTIDQGDDTFRATLLGHPLLHADARVRNDVTIGPPGTFLLVTGSNMSGKSTLLRAVGVNTVLAQAGGPVCADALSLPPVEPWTSARVQDSLERGVSFFLAELQRLKLIVDAATRARDHGGPRVLYLLDEILQGTNTAERSVAARRVIAYLVEQGAIGAVSTHDLALADDPRLAPAATTVHFTDTVGEGPDSPPMSFDYRLRPGVATTTNALRLMRLIGLELEDAPV
jgi:DNA mismatch repair ATPase MutS